MIEYITHDFLTTTQSDHPDQNKQGSDKRQEPFTVPDFDQKIVSISPPRISPAKHWRKVPQRFKVLVIEEI